MSLSIGANSSDSGPCAGVGNPPIADIPPLAKPVMADDEKCLPWNLSEAQAASARVKAYAVNLRGRAWILAGSYQVARLETDLVESISNIRLRLDHQSVEYRPVKSSTSNLRLWLPSSTELYMDFQGRRFYRKHAFTDFKIFSVDTQYHIADRKETATEQ